MGLQMKCTLEKNKKGFTLVELVVVIAVLAILAAIAIPTVIGIINRASESQSDTNASLIDGACKDYFAMVKSGQINSTNHGGSTQTGLPGENASYASRIVAANNATIKNALEYSGIYSTLSGDILPTSTSFVYDSDGSIYSAEKSSLTTYVNENITLGALYN